MPILSLAITPNTTHRTSGPVSSVATALHTVVPLVFHLLKVPRAMLTADAAVQLQSTLAEVGDISYLEPVFLVK